MLEIELMLIISVGACMLGLSLLLVHQHRNVKEMQHNVLALQAQLSLFTDTSINVARSVDKLLHLQSQPKPNNQASRRWLLDEAKARLAEGAEVKDVAIPLGLCRDEIRLLTVLGRSRLDSLQHSH